MVIDIIASVLIVSGVALTLLAGIGLQRFDDVFARMHAATKAITLGLLLIVIAASFEMEQRGDVAKLLLAATLQFITAPVAAHMVGRAAYRAGTEVSPKTSVDELAVAIERRRAAGDDDDHDGQPDPPPPHLRERD
jgi:multicomponent Na+:H+ antiporter subunit G